MSDDHIPYLEYGSGPPLHFAHANAYPPGSYRQLLSALGEQYHVTAMCQRPLWLGQRPEEMEAWQLFADDLIRFCKQQALENIIGVGHSLGAVVTMMAALRAPRLFRCLVLIEPVFLPPALLQTFKTNAQETPIADFVQRTLNRRHRWPSRQAAFDRFRAKPVFQRLSDEALWDYVNSGLHELDNGRVALAFPRQWEARIYSRPPLDVWELIPQLSLPTLILRGEASDTLHRSAWKLLQSLQPSAQLVEVPDTGHLLPLERPAVVAQNILQFLQGANVTAN